MKKKNISNFFFVSIGIVGLILFIFGLQCSGTLCDEIETAGLIGLGVFGLWAVAKIANAYAERKELENISEK